MRSRTTAVLFCLLASVGLAGLSGTYTIKPGGGGDFLSLYAAGEALTDSGISGDCVFELYGDTLPGLFSADNVAGSDTWMTTFRPGPGASPVIVGGQFTVSAYHNVKLDSLWFYRAPITIGGSSGWRISGCRFSTHDHGISLDGCTSDTVDGNAFEMLPTLGRHDPVLIVGAGSDNVVFNNMVNSDSCDALALVLLGNARNTRFFFNTLRQSTSDRNYGSCIWIMSEGSCEVRDNVFVLARPAVSTNACVCLMDMRLGSIVLNNNCYFVETLGHIGAYPITRRLYTWHKWRVIGFEANGINADPMLTSVTDLHLRQGSPCIGAAAPIPGIGFDIDGDPRDQAHPDIGADEFTGGEVEESPEPPASGRELAPTVVQRLPADAAVFDAMGRQVMDLKPGVYFVREGEGKREQGAAGVRKVVVTR